MDAVVVGQGVDADKERSGASWCTRVLLLVQHEQQQQQQDCGEGGEA